MNPDDPFYQTPANFVDPVIEAYKQDVDRTMLIENLKLTTQQRSERFIGGMKLVFELRRHAAKKRSRERQ